MKGMLMKPNRNGMTIGIILSTIVGCCLLPLMGLAQNAGENEVNFDQMIESDTDAQPADAGISEMFDDAGAVKANTTVPDVGDVMDEGEEAPAPMMTTEQGSNKISISLDQVPVMDVIRMFSRMSGANIVIGTELKGMITVSMTDVEWKSALKAILDSVDLALVDKGNGIYTIIEKAQLALEPLEIDTYKLKYLTVRDAQPVVKSMLVRSNATVVVVGGNTFVIKETISNLQKIRETLGKIDRPRLQVFIEAKFVELSDNAIEDLGIKWESLSGYTLKALEMGRAIQDQRYKDIERSTTGLKLDDRTQQDVLTDNFTVDSQEMDTSGRARVDTINRGQSIVQNTVDSFTKNIDDYRTALLTASDFSVVLSALKSMEGVEVLSNPKIIVANGETASINVTRQEPNIVAQPQGDSGDRYAYSQDGWINIGVQLEVTPTVNTESNITVKVAPELSRKLGDKEVSGVGLAFPIKSTRRIETEFNIESGRTVAIGGLTQTDEQTEVTKIPLLGDIPVLGKYLFSHKHKELVQDELVIFVTVSLANANIIKTSPSAGIPSLATLIHKHMAENDLQLIQSEDKNILGNTDSN